MTPFLRYDTCTPIAQTLRYLQLVLSRIRKLQCHPPYEVPPSYITRSLIRLRGSIGWHTMQDNVLIINSTVAVTMRSRQRKSLHEWCIELLHKTRLKMMACNSGGVSNYHTSSVVLPRTRNVVSYLRLPRMII